MFHSRLIAFGALGMGLWLALIFSVSLLQSSDANGGEKKATPSAKEIVNKAIAAHGGAKILGKRLALIRLEEGDMVIENDKLPVKAEYQFQPPDLCAYTMVTKIGQLRFDVRAGMTDAKGWIKYGPAAVADMPDDELKGQRFLHNNHVINIQILNDVERDYDLSAPVSVRFADRDAWKISFSHRTEKRVVDLLFDKMSGLVLGSEAEHRIQKLDFRGKDDGKPSVVRVVFDSYVDVGGMKMAGAMRAYRDSVLMLNIRTVQVRIVDQVDPKVFEKPK